MMRAGPGAGLGAATAVLVLPLLAGCGHSQSYCDTVKAHQSELGTIVSDGGPTALVRALPAFEDLTAHAPSDVAADWKLLVARVTALQSALEKASVDPASYDPHHPPPGLSTEDQGSIRRAAVRLAAADTQQALTSVQQEVLDVCRTPVEM
jgi:hypothetical protein